MFEQFDRVPGTFQFRNLLQLLNKQLCQVSRVSFFERMNKGELKIGKNLDGGNPGLGLYVNLLKK